MAEVKEAHPTDLDKNMEYMFGELFGAKLWEQFDSHAHSLAKARRYTLWIQNYFDKTENVLRDFEHRANDIGLELRAKTKDRGYVFCANNQKEREFEVKTVNAQKLFESQGIIVSRKVIDYIVKIGMFSWETAR